MTTDVMNYRYAHRSSITYRIVYSDGTVGEPTVDLWLSNSLLRQSKMGSLFGIRPVYRLKIREKRKYS